jgi:hypothetical protein
MAQQTSNQGFGNLVPAPQLSYIDEITPIEILFSTVGLQQKGMTIKAGQGKILAGTAMARETATKKWVKYNDAGSGGFEICRGFLRDTVDTGSTGDPEYLGNIVNAGMLRNSKLVGVDAAAIADLNARQDTVQDLFQF